MDRYQGLEQMSAEEAEALTLLLDRQEWERDQGALAEYENWHRQKTEREGNANNTAAR